MPKFYIYLFFHCKLNENMITIKLEVAAFVGAAKQTDHIKTDLRTIVVSTQYIVPDSR
jgi:hypothetical protein